MWRFLTSVHRAFRHHVQKPRPSAGAVVEEDKSESDNDEQQTSSAHLCPYVALRQRVQKPYHPEHVCNNREHDSGTVTISTSGSNNSNNGTILAKFGCGKGQRQGAPGSESCTNSGQDRDRNWWRQCHQDFWSLVQGSSCRVAEAVSLGSFFFCGGDSDRQRSRSRLLYRILFALPEKQKAALCMTSATSDVSEETKDNATAGQASDEKDNQSKTEEQNLDSVFAEFNQLCQDYSAVSESLQGLEAWERGDTKSGVEHLSEAADLGHASACFNMALCYETGIEVSVDTNKAQKYYKMAAEKGHSMAMYNLGLLYFNQSGMNLCVSKDTKEFNFEKEGLQMMERAAKHGLAEAQTYMGFHHMYHTQDLAQALTFFTSAAQQKYGEAQYLLGLCHEQGWGVEVNECRAALLFSQAAAGGHDLATCCLAEYNEKGMGGLPEDKASAKNLYTKAADMGNQVARTRLNELLAQEKLDFWRNKVSSFQEKLKIFQELYQVHHNEDLKGDTSPQPLSPSASSPNLTNHQGADYFLLNESENRKTKKDFQLKISFDRDKKLGIDFTLGESLDILEDDSETETNYSSDISFDSCLSGSGDEAAFSLGSFHKSNTVPNLAII